MAHKIIFNGEEKTVSSVHETWLADGLTIADIPPKSVVALVAMGAIERDTEGVQGKFDALTEALQNQIQLNALGQPCGTCPGAPAKKAEPKAEPKEEPKEEPKAVAVKATPVKATPRKTRKPRTKKA